MPESSIRNPHSQISGAEGIYAEICENGVRWCVDQELAEAFSAWLARRGEAPRDLIRENRLRSIWRVQAILPQGIVLKESRPVGLARILRRCFPGRRSREWENAQVLHASGGIAPRPLAAGWTGVWGPDFLAMERVPGKSLDDFGWSDYAALTSGQRRALLARLGLFLKALEDRLVRAKDLHAGNILIEEAPGGTGRLFLVDLADVRIGRPLSARTRLGQVARLAASMGFLSARDRARLVKAYGDAVRIAPGRDRRAFARAVDAEVRRVWHRHWKSRTRRCMKTSGAFEAVRGWRRSVFRRREFELAWIDEATTRFYEALENAQHSALSTQRLGHGPTVVKNAPESQVVRGLPGSWGGAICIKRYRPRGLGIALGSVGRLSRAVRGWVAANGFVERNLETARPLALVTEGWGCWRPQGYLILEDLASQAPENGRELDRRLCLMDWRTLPRAEKGAWIRSLADAVRHLHFLGVCLRDAKACNLFLLGADPARARWAWVDLEGTRFTRHLGIPERIRFLVQLNLSIPGFVTTRERVRFFRRYAAGMPRATRRGLLRGVARFSRYQKILYVGLEGDVEEEWS